PCLLLHHCVRPAARKPPATGPIPSTPSAGWRNGNTRLANQLSGHFRLEPLEVPDDLPGLLGLLPVDMNPRELIPAVRAHGLQLRVALERLGGLVEAAQAYQHEAEAIPGAIELRIELRGAAQGRLGTFPVALFLQQVAVVEPV